ncbi:uncharacterized protein IUM83_02195 [Phytophthora cinnamomi]|uniref:uncharacterized protein n=1 Tax=Phytophthora cinnamomi TaxID=4785 RepID=UPI00355A1BC8|nr:hypothetical protein IUM83_02195 [Phytophthora cinnamomi]
MRELFARFPELVMIDTTHGTNSSKYKIFSIMAHDAFGKGQFVQHAVIQNEHNPTLLKALEQFKRYNPAWSRIKCILIDKDFGEISVLKKNFPGRGVGVVSVSRVEISGRADSVKGLWVQCMAEAATKRINLLVYAKTERQYLRLREYMRHIIDVGTGALSDGVVGVDIFLGEEAVVTYVIESGLLDVSDESANGATEADSEVDAITADSAGGRVNDIAVGEADVEIKDGVTVSQIDTSVQLSQRAVDALFGSPTASDADTSVTNSQQRPLELSQGAVVRAFDITPSALHNGESQRDIIGGATQLLHISEASAVESSDTENTPARPSISRREIPRRGKRDVNYLDDNEDENDYENLSSDDSEDGDAADVDDDDVARPGQNDDDDCLSEADAVLMDEAFIASIGQGDDDALSRVLPATSKRNTTRMFMPDKPHRYGTKMFMTCDSKTAYCHRFEVYVGKREVGDTQADAVDHKIGAAAVIRNLKVVLAHNRLAYHAVVVDRFYSSIPLAVELLTMSVYIVGIIMTNRLGFNRNVRETRRTRPSFIPRGSFTFSRSVAVPSMVVFHWWDRKPVHYLCTGSAMAESTIKRNVKRVGPITVPCPSAVNDYQRWMGGVDVHDQLRLQRFSLQTSVRLQKYYKSLFLGFLDLAMVNAYLSHKEACKLNGTTAMKRGEWYSVLQNQLLQLKAQDFQGITVTPPTRSGKRVRKRTGPEGHSLAQFGDWVTVSGVQKRRPRSCKVCALLRGARKKSFQTTYYCESCSLDDAKCYLCPKARREYKGAMKTCFQIWHEDFECGLTIPPTLGKRAVLCRPGQETGLPKKTRRELQMDARSRNGDASVASANSDMNDDDDFE